MAIYHCSVKIISRSQGRSATGAAAYRSGEKIHDERTGLTHDYTRKSGVDHTEIMTPKKTPSWVHNRSTLWNEVERIEKRKDAQLCREVEVALPCELSRTENQTLVRSFVEAEFIDRGMIADIAFHHMDSDNPHAHILLTTREITPQGFGNKNRNWNKKDHLETWRQSWQEHANTALELAGHEARIDHRTLEAQGIERIPQIHLGAKVTEMEKRGIRTERGKKALEIEETNEKIINLQEYREALTHEYNLSLEASTNTGTIGAADRTHGASLGDTGRSGYSTLGGTENSEQDSHTSLDRSTDKHGQGMGGSSQNRERCSAPDDGLNESSHRSDERMADASDIDLSDQFNHAYGSAFDRILDLARPANRDQRGHDVAHTSDKRLDRTYLAVRRQLKALGAKLYDIGIKTAKGMLSREWSMEQVLKHIPWLKRENAKGADIYVRPAGNKNQGMILVDDLNQRQIENMKSSGYEPAAVVETSPHNYQAWVKLTDQELSPQLATAISKGIARHFEADPNSADWRHFGRLAGFTNQKPEHTTATGRNPWVLCHEASGKQACKGEQTVETVGQRLKQLKAEMEKESRLKQAVEASGAVLNYDPIRMYQKQFKALYERYGADMDMSRADFMICISMAKQGFTSNQLQKTLEQASPELSIRKANHEQDYCQRTVKAVFEDPQVQAHLERQHSRGYSL